MPGGDGTGPAGMGPMTGRAAGYCAGYPVPGFMNPVPGRGFGGWGRGRGNWPYAAGLPVQPRGVIGSPAFMGSSPSPFPYASPFAPTMTREQELDVLKGQAEYFEDALEGINKRIKELEKEAGKQK